jgi:Phage integrase family
VAILTVGAQEIARWQQEMLTAENGPKTVLNAVQILSSVFKHARRFKWIPTNLCEDVKKPKYKEKVRAFTAAEVALLAQKADESTALLIRTGASTGPRFGVLAGLEWEYVDLEAGALRVAKQFTHSPPHPPREGARQGAQASQAPHPGDACLPRALLFAKTGPDEENPQRVAIEGTFHMLRHFFVTALISSGVNAKVAQTLAGHHSAAFTLDQYADAVPQQLEEAGEKVASVLLSGSILVAAPKTPAPARGQVIELNGAPGEIRTPDLLVRSQALYPTELRAHLSKIIGGGEGGIRTLDGLLTHTPLAGARLRPLGHLSGSGQRAQTKERRMIPVVSSPGKAVGT